MPKGNHHNRNTQGLRPFNQMDEKAAREIQSAGGKAKAESEAVKRQVRDIVQMLLFEKPQLTKSEERLIASMGVSDDKIDIITLGVLKQIEKMRDGNTEVYKLMLEQSGLTESQPQIANYAPILIVDDIPVQDGGKNDKR